MIAGLVVGKRVYRALNINNPDHSVPWYIYAMGIGLPVILFLLPRVITAIGVDVDPDKVRLRYLGGRIRDYQPKSIRLKSRGQSIFVIEGRPLNGSRKTSYLLAAGFSNGEWDQVTATIKAATAADCHD